MLETTGFIILINQKIDAMREMRGLASALSSYKIQILYQGEIHLKTEAIKKLYCSYSELEIDSRCLFLFDKHFTCAVIKGEDACKWLRKIVNWNKSIYVPFDVSENDKFLDLPEFRHIWRSQNNT